VQGGCIGGALDLAAACDIRVCSADAFFTVQEIHIGMAADLGVLQRLPKIVPPGVAREMAYTGERVGAERALAVGLVNAVLPDAAALLAHALDLARPSPPSRRWRWPAASWRSTTRSTTRRRRAAADDAAAERHLRHRRDGGARSPAWKAKLAPACTPCETRPAAHEAAPDMPFEVRP
jgi:enoyl-CoA hydratase/carnithine racemase